MDQSLAKGAEPIAPRDSDHVRSDQEAGPRTPWTLGGRRTLMPMREPRDQTLEGGDAFLETVCRLTAKLLGVSVVGLSVEESGTLPIRRWSGTLASNGHHIFHRWMAQTAGGEPYVVQDVDRDAGGADLPPSIFAFRPLFIAVVPFLINEGQADGFLYVVDSAQRQDFGDEQVGQLRDIASLVEEHLRLLAAHKGREREGEILCKALDGMDQGLLVTDAKDRVRTHNRQAAELTGIPKTLLRDGSSLEAVRAHQTEAGEFAGLLERLRRWLERGEPCLCVPAYERECLNGNVLEVRTTPTRDGGIVRTYTDVTAQRATERALREEERRFRLIAENVGDVMILNHLDLTRRYVSPAVSSVLGYEPSEFIVRTPLDDVHPDDTPQYLQAVENVRLGCLDRALTTQRYRHRSGEWVWMEVATRLTRDLETGELDGFVSTLRDVTARKMAEDRLRDSEARHRALVDSLPQMVLVADAATGDALYVNQGYIASRGSIAPARDARRGDVHHEDLDRFDRLWIEAKKVGGRAEAEVRLRRHDGAHRWHKMVMVPVVQNGIVESVVSTALDIDEIITAREELERTSDLLRLAQAAAGAGVWEWDEEQDRVWLSPTSARMHGLSSPNDADEPVVLSLTSWAACVDVRDLSSVREAAERNAEAGVTNDAVYRTRPRNNSGDLRWIHSFSRVVPKSTGGRPTRFVGLHLDVTTRREAEEALRSGEARLRLSEERLALALEGSGDGLFDTDLATGAQWLSRHWVEQLGYDDACCRQPFDFWFGKVHPEHRDQLRAAFGAHLRGVTDKVENEHRLERADGTYVWVLARARTVSWDEHGRPLRVVGTLIDVSRRKEAEARATHMAEHDALTGLPNRHVFRRQLEDARARGAAQPNCHAVLACDLDRFKAVNDTLGHLAGDRLLQATADRFQSVLAEQHLVARLGGDEFAFVLDGVDGTRGTRDVCARLVAAMDEPIVLDGTPVQVGVSIGAVLVADDGADADEVFKRADTALFEAKRAGRNTFRLFDADAHARVASRSQLALDMREAVRRGEFYLAYQPIVDVTSCEVSAFEALMRWRHPQRGLVSPAEFIPIAEESGAILQIGTFALAEACREATRWPDAVRVSVNVSAVQFRGDLEQIVTSSLGASGLSPGRLTLEVTESALMDDPEQVGSTLARLRAFGVRVALDDFGTGYSSLGYLRRFPFDTLKLDRSFVRDIADPDAAAIIRAVVGIGDRLGMHVVAEGVETKEQLQLVRAEGCGQVQGYLFSHPLLAHEALDYAFSTEKRTP